MKTNINSEFGKAIKSSEDFIVYPVTEDRYSIAVNGDIIGYIGLDYKWRKVGLDVCITNMAYAAQFFELAKYIARCIEPAIIAYYEQMEA